MEEFLEKLCDNCKQTSLCLTQEQADEICERCQLESDLFKLLQTAYNKGHDDALKEVVEAVRL